MTSPEDRSPSEATAQGTHSQGNENKTLAIQRIYVKDLSFESPRAPQVFSDDWRPRVDVNLSSEARPLASGLFEVELVVTVSVKSEENAAFLVEVHQAGLFQVNGFPESELGPLLGSYCPNLLFPYAREVVSDLVAKGGFPQFLLAPVSFDALYARQTQQRQGAKPEDVSQH